jgi:hypothetical protein
MTEAQSLPQVWKDVKPVELLRKLYRCRESCWERCRDTERPVELWSCQESCRAVKRQ